MEGFYLLCGHLLGDYILQNDWMATHKSELGPSGVRPCSDWNDNVGGGGVTPAERDRWDAQYRAGIRGAEACAVHCLLYTLAVWLFSFWWLPLWGLAVCFLAHYALDRYRLARRWMSLAGQEKFATSMSPWSVIVVDNTFHLLTLAAIASAIY